MIKINIPITKHIINRITNVLACVLIIDFTSIPQTGCCTQNFHLTNARIRINIIKRYITIKDLHLLLKKVI